MRKKPFIPTALAVLTGDTLTDFALALLVGLVVGTYSSVFTATPPAVELHSRAGEFTRGPLAGEAGDQLVKVNQLMLVKSEVLPAKTR